MSAESNVSRLDEARKPDRPAPDSDDSEDAADAEYSYAGARCSKDRLRRYNKAWVIGEFSDRSAFILAACDALADKILGPEAAAG